MTEKQIIEETLRYIKDKSYRYAILIDGEWGSGKTYFVKNKLTKEINEDELKEKNPRIVKYISLYGCKDITDIQESLVWGIADEAYEYIRKKKGEKKLFGEKKSGEVGKNILLSTKKIGNEIVRKFLPGKTIYDIASEWINLESYIFIFDDLERCDCPINEVFGMLNGLVEHEGTKVIIVANEKEIDIQRINENAEFQYLLALDSTIEWPESGENNFYRRQNNDKIKLNELKKRRDILFPSDEIVSDYKKIREKLVGVKLRYQPDLETVIEQMIISTQYHNDDRREMLLLHKEEFMDSMNSYEHHNLRTFQFFLSKIDYLLTEIDKFDIDTENKKEVDSVIIRETFRRAIEYKCNYRPKKEPDSIFDQKEFAKSEVVREYVEKGEFCAEKFGKDISNIVAEIKSDIPSDDPYNLIWQEYYLHEQRWNEEQLENMLARLKNDKYPIELYEKIISAVVRLVNIGFNEEYLCRTKEYILLNIKKHETAKRLETDLWFIEGAEIKGLVKDVIDEINIAVDSHSEIQKKKTVNEILHSSNWVKELELYTNSLAEGSYKSISIFSKAEAKCWYEKIHKATPKDIYDFRIWLKSIYPTSASQICFSEDAQVIIDLWKMMDPEKEDDLIKRKCTNWLKNQIYEIIKINKPEWNEDREESTR